MPLDDNVTLAMVDKCVKFDGRHFDSAEVMAKVKVFTMTMTTSLLLDDNTRVITITQPFFFKKQPS